MATVRQVQHPSEGSTKPDEQHVGQILFRAGERMREEINEYCICHDLSQRAFLVRAVREYIQRHS